MGEPWTLALSAAEPDLEFASIQALAREIVRRRDLRPVAHPITLTPCHLSRGGLPAHSCVSVRVHDSDRPGTGSLIGYAIAPPTLSSGRGFDPKTLMAAILLVAPALAEAA